MKKNFTNSDIKVIYHVLNVLKGRDDIIISDMNIFWAIHYNLKLFKEKVMFIQEITNEKIKSYFTEETTNEVNGEKVLKEECEKEIIAKINEDTKRIDAQSMEIDVCTIKLDALKTMSKINENRLSMLDMTILEQFIEDED